jgi:hypothetical protein
MSFPSQTKTFLAAISFVSLHSTVPSVVQLSVAFVDPSLQMQPALIPENLPTYMLEVPSGHAPALSATEID